MAKLIARAYRGTRHAKIRRVSVEVLEPRRLLARHAVWVEAEQVLSNGQSNPSFVSSTFNMTDGAGSWFNSFNVNTALLSGGRWLSSFVDAGSPSNTTPVTASYSVNFPQAGQYDWWIRLNPFGNSSGGGVYDYRVGNGAWTRIDVSEVANSVNLLNAPAIDIRFIGWAYVGKLNFDAGSNSISIRMSAPPGGSQVYGGVDVMSFNNYGAAPAGITPLNPNPPAPGPDDWFNLSAGPDTFSANSVIDLSGLLENNAGENGRIVRSGDKLVDARGTERKFWGIGADPASNTNNAALDRQARFYAKHGINVVRLHSVNALVGNLIGPRNARRFDPAKIDLLDRWFAKLKENGIYTTFSVVYHHTIQPDERVSQGGTIPDALYNELPDRDGGKDAYGLASFVRQYQDSQWAYFNALMNHTNPYTGLKYKDDPAVLSVEMRNEDSVFFHNPLTLVFNERNSSKAAHANLLRSMFGTWVKNRYGTEAALNAAWGTARQPADNWNAGVFEIMGAYHFGSNGPLYEFAGQTRRAGDFIEFLHGLQKADYQHFYNRLRGTGYQGLIVTTAWKSGEPAAEPANNNTDDVGDMIDRHNYFGGGLSGPGWQINLGGVRNQTHLDKPGRGILSSGFNQVEDKPFAMSEWTQSPPNQWKAEAAPLIALYGMGLQGWDASYQFTGRYSYMANGWPGLNSFVSETPHYMGQFPALAYAIYNNHIEQGSVVSARRVSNTQMFSGTDPLQTVLNRENNDASEIVSQGGTPSEALAVGRVTLKTGVSTPSASTDLTPYINNATSTVTSTTGQLRWNWNRRTVEIRADKTQGVVGFAGGQTFNLPGFDVTVNTPFVSLLFTAMDNQPLTRSRNIVITAMAQDRQLGTTYNADGSQLTNIGVEPLQLQPVKATITVKGDPLGAVRVLDVYGVPTGATVEKNGSTFTIDGRHASYYYQITRSLDTDPPTVSPSSRFEVNDRNAFILNFSEPVGNSLLSSNITLTNRTTGEVIPRNGLTITMNPNNTTATVRATNPIPNGFYRLLLPPGSVVDAQGNSLASPFQIDTHILPGDANRDRTVNFSDLVILARNFNQSPRLFTQGDFDFSGTVNFSDLVILARHFNVTLTQPPSVLGGGAGAREKGNSDLLR